MKKSKQKSDQVKRLATVLTEHGYGASRDEIVEILNKLSAHELHSLFYNVCRTSEKCGTEALYKAWRPEG